MLGRVLRRRGTAFGGTLGDAQLGARGVEILSAIAGHEPATMVVDAREHDLVAVDVEHDVAVAERREAEPLDLQVAHHRQRALALLAHAIADRHPHRVEDQLGGERRPNSELVSPLLTQCEAGHPLSTRKAVRERSPVAA